MELPATTASGSDTKRIAGKVTAKAIRALLEWQRYRCALTGLKLTPETVALDHIEPLNGGGADDMANVQLVHAVVNTMKGTLSESEFIAWCRAVATHRVSDDAGPPLGSHGTV